MGRKEAVEDLSWKKDKQLRIKDFGSEGFLFHESMSHGSMSLESSYESGQQY